MPQCLTLRPAPARSRRLNMRQGLCCRHGSSPLHENSPFCAGCREPNRGKALALGAQRLCALQNAGFLAADLRSTARPLLLRAPLSLRHACTHMVSALSSFTGPSSQRGPKPRVNPQWSLTPRSTPTRSGRRCKPGLRYFVLCSQPRLTTPTSAGGVTSNVRPHRRHMGCVLHFFGATADVAELERLCPIEPCNVFRKGESVRVFLHADALGTRLASFET
jgi:hypothetical protein